MFRVLAQIRSGRTRPLGACVPEYCPSHFPVKRSHAENRSHQIVPGFFRLRRDVDVKSSFSREQCDVRTMNQDEHASQFIALGRDVHYHAMSAFFQSGHRAFDFRPKQIRTA